MITNVLPRFFMKHNVYVERSSCRGCTVVPAVVKANSQSNGSIQISTPSGTEVPERISMKLGIYNVGCGCMTEGRAGIQLVYNTSTKTVFLS